MKKFPWLFLITQRENNQNAPTHAIIIDSNNIARSLFYKCNLNVEINEKFTSKLVENESLITKRLFKIQKNTVTKIMYIFEKRRQFISEIITKLSVVYQGDVIF